MRIGCHAVLFTEQIAANTGAVLSGLAATGCEGVEIGSRFFGVDKNSELKAMMEEHGLELSGLHAVVQLTDLLDAPEAARETIRKAAAFLKVMPNKNIILTGVKQMPAPDGTAVADDVRLSDPQAVGQMARMLQELAVMAGDEGVRLHYHNHDWEFEHDGLLYQALITEAPALRLALDTGWAGAAGWSPAAMIEARPERFSYVHIRDFKFVDMARCRTHTERQECYVDLGEGDVDLPVLMATLRKYLPDDGWAVIEYEKGCVSYERYRRAADYLKAL